MLKIVVIVGCLTMLNIQAYKLPKILPSIEDNNSKIGLYILFIVLTIIVTFTQLLLIVYSSLDRELIQKLTLVSDTQTQIDAIHILKAFFVYNLLICLLLFLKILSYVALPIIAYQIFQNIYLALIVSIAIVFLLGQIISLIFCSPQYSLRIARYLIPLVNVLYSINQKIDINCRLKYLMQCFFLKKQQKLTINEANITSLLSHHQIKPYGYKHEQIQYLQNINQLKDVNVKALSIQMQHIFMVNISTQIHHQFISNLNQYYFTKILIYSGHKHNIIGFIQVKRLLGLDLSQKICLQDIFDSVGNRNIVEISENHHAFEAYQLMQSNKINFALIISDSKNRYNSEESANENKIKKYVGLIKMKDIVKNMTLKWYNYESLNAKKTFTTLHSVISKQHEIQKMNKLEELVEANEQL